MKSEKLKTYDDFKARMEVLGTQEEPGLMIVTPTKSKKIFTQQYVNLLNIRGGESSIRLRYIQLVIERNTTNDDSKIEKFKSIYSEKTIENLDRELKNIPHKLMDIYRQRYISGNYLQLPPAVHHVIQDVFLSYKNAAKKRSSEIYSLIDRIHHELSKRDAKNVNHIYKYIKQSTRKSKKIESLTDMSEQK
jgi:hypothetical protein